MPDSGNRYSLVVTCGYSKCVEAFRIANQEAETVANVLVRELFCRYGCPRVIHSDQGRNFESRLFKEVYRHMDVNKTRMTGYHPQANQWSSRAVQQDRVFHALYVCRKQSEKLGFNIGKSGLRPHIAPGSTRQR